MATSRDKVVIGVFVIMGLAFAAAAVTLVCVTIFQPLWTVWGRDEMMRIIDRSYGKLFQTEEDMLSVSGLLDNNCTSYVVRKDTKNGLLVVRKWDCPSQNQTTPPQNQTSSSTGAVTRRRRQTAPVLSGVSDNDNCCATLLVLSQPEMLPVSLAGVGSAHVVNQSWLSPPRYQFIHEGQCGNPGLCNTLSGGTCLLHPRSQPVLVSLDPITSQYDLLLAVYYEKVWFENYEFPGSCKCV